MKRDYYTVNIPRDLTDDIKFAGQQAVTEAEEKTRLYCIPATWEATLVDTTMNDYIFRVRRTRN